jgi:HD superfamily phosphodiesterase
MTDYFKGDQKRINHFIKVHSFGKLIAESEGLDRETTFIIETATLTHDIGIKKGEELYNRNDGKIQEQLGPKEAEKLLSSLGFQKEVIKRVMYLIAHHHTYKNITEVDYQILVEADFLVNIPEDNISPLTALNIKEKIFKTSTGKLLLENLF